MRLTSVVLIGSLFLGSPAAWADAGPTRLDLTMTVKGTDQDLGETPVVIEVNPRQLPTGRYRLEPANGGTSLAALVYQDQDRTFLGFILPKVAAGSTSRYQIAGDSSQAARGQGITLAPEGRRLAVRVDGKAWTTYVPDDGPKPYFDPLIGPTDQPLTRAWPMREVAGEPRDHPHHRSLWLAHMDVNKANTWDENPGHGQIRETSRPTVVGGGGPVGVLRTTDDWLDRSGQKVCEDERVVRFYATAAARVFDFDFTLKASNGPVEIGDNKDGVFAVRVAATLALTARQGGQIVNSRGVRDNAAWGQPAEWVDYTGPIGGATMGIALLNHPSSFRFPTTWHVRGYGLFAANPFGWRDFGQTKSGEHRIEPGGSIRLAYRVILHRGTTEQAGIDSLYQSYANPPQIMLQ